MSDQGKESQHTPPQAGSETLLLGRREDIARVGKSVYGGEGRLSVYMDTGFLNPDRSHHKKIVRCTTKEANQVDANVADVLIPKLQAEWDEADSKRRLANALGPQPETGPDVPNQVYTTKVRILKLLEHWRKEKIGTFGGYNTVGKQFVDISGDLADREREKYTVPECVTIREKMLAQWDAHSDTPAQNMRNLRFVLREIDFPAHLIELFSSKDERKRNKVRKDMTLTPQAREQLWQGRKLANSDEEWLYLCSANGTMNLVDIALARPEQVHAALNKESFADRMKNGNPFCFTLWDATREAFEKREQPQAAYILWRAVFTEEELKKDPNIIFKRLTPEEEKARKRAATARARRIFYNFVLKCGFEKAINHRWFRNTNITGWEAAGVPRRVGMDASGHSKEENYLRYARSTVPQMDGLAELTLEIYSRPGMAYILTHTQSVAATEKNIKKSEERVCATIEKSSFETVRATADSIKESEARVCATIQISAEALAELLKQSDRKIEALQMEIRAEGKLRKLTEEKLATAEAELQTVRRELNQSHAMMNLRLQSIETYMMKLALREDRPPEVKAPALVSLPVSIAA